MHSNKKNKQRPRQSRSYRSLSCPLCDFVPITKGEITRKIRRHVFSAHQMQGEKVPPEWQSEGYQCPLCDYISYDNCRITRHMKIHARRAEVLPDGYVAIEMQTNHDWVLQFYKLGLHESGCLHRASPISGLFWISHIQLRPQQLCPQSFCSNSNVCTKSLLIGLIVL